MIKKIATISFQLLLLTIMVLCLFWYQIVIYGISQGKGQLTIIWNSQPIEKVLEETSFPDSLKQKLRLIIEIKKYAFDSLGINPSNNYSSVYNQYNKPILLTVSACEPYVFKAKEWTFPFLGSVPYKGFFNKMEAKKEVRLLKQQGYDVDVYSPSGWSTLGWFNDPIQTSMLYKSEGQLANLIIHELTHGTLYVKNNVTFNENLANFIGDKGAEQFLIKRFGKESKKYLNYLQDKTDNKIYTNYILNETDSLKLLYSSFKPTDSEGFKKLKKQNLISKIVLGVTKLPLYKRKNYFKYTLQSFAEGNAFFMAFNRYDSQYDYFDNEFKLQYNSDLKKYLNAMKKKYSTL